MGKQNRSRPRSAAPAAPAPMVGCLRSCDTGSQTTLDPVRGDGRARPRRSPLLAAVAAGSGDSAERAPASPRAAGSPPERRRPLLLDLYALETRLAGAERRARRPRARGRTALEREEAAARQQPRARRERPRGGRAASRPPACASSTSKARSIRSRCSSAPSPSTTRSRPLDGLTRVADAGRSILGQVRRGTAAASATRSRRSGERQAEVGALVASAESERATLAAARAERAAYLAGLAAGATSNARGRPPDGEGVGRRARRPRRSSTAEGRRRPPRRLRRRRAGRR